MSKKEEKAKEYADNEVKRYHEHSGVIEKYGIERARMSSEHESWELEEAYQAGWNEAMKSQWVSVEEKMPEIWKDVLVFIIRDTDVQIHKSTYFGEKDWSFGGIKIIAWMPIPSFDEILEANKDVLKQLNDK